MKQIEIQHGILVERAKEIYSFAHLTFQEYFAANFIVDRANHEAFESLIDNYLYDDRWHVIFLMISEMLFDIEIFVLLMIKKNRKLLNDPILEDLLRISSHETKVVNKAKLINFILVMKRDEIRSCERGYDYALDKPQSPENAKALYNALKGLNALDECIEKVIKKTFDLMKILDPESINIDPDIYKPNYHEKKQLAQDKINTYVKRFKCNIEKINKFVNNQYYRESVSVENYKIIELFTKGNILICLCIQSKPNLSLSIREKILNEMLMPRKEEE